MRKQKDLRVLVIAHRYDVFIKELVEATSRYVAKIDVFIHYNPLSEISNYIKDVSYFDHLRRFTKQNLINTKRKPPNVEIHLIPVVYFLPDGKNKQLGDKLAKRFKEYITKNNMKFDLIHAHFTYPQGYVAVELGKEFNVPVIATAHGHDVYELPFKNKNWNKKISLVLKNANHITTVSYLNKQILTDKLNIDKDKISVIPNGFNPNIFKIIPKKIARKKLGLKENKKIILTVSRLYPEKGLEYLINAVDIVVNDNKKRDVLCIIIGDGILRKKIENMLPELNLKEYIKLAGFKPHEEIPIWMNAADVFVLPSLEEGNPTVMFEALGCGLPFIGTKVGGIPEIITSEDCGLLTEPANSKDLAEKILMALEREWNRKTIRKYAEQFTWENIGKKYVDLYNKAIGTY